MGQLRKQSCYQCCHFFFFFVRIHGMRASSGLETVTTQGTESSRETCPPGLGDEGRSLAGGGIGHSPLT